MFCVKNGHIPLGGVPMSESDDLRPSGTATLAGEEDNFVGVALVGELGGTTPSSGSGKLEGDWMLLAGKFSVIELRRDDWLELLGGNIGGKI